MKNKEWIEVEFECELNIRFQRDPETFEDNFQDVIEAIESL